MGQETNWDRHVGLAGKSVLQLAGATSFAPAQFVVTPQEPRAIFAQYHSNMANTGSYMVRKGPWKYISFGHTLAAFSPKVYTPLLLNVDEDPSELQNLAAQRGQIVEQLEAELRMLLDPSEIDSRAKREDFHIYKRFFGSLCQDELRKKLKANYQGFDDGDFEKLQKWAKEISATLPPEGSPTTFVV